MVDLKQKGRNTKSALKFLTLPAGSGMFFLISLFLIAGSGSGGGSSTLRCYRCKSEPPDRGLDCEASPPKVDQTNDSGRDGPDWEKKLEESETSSSKGAGDERYCKTIAAHWTRTDVWKFSRLKGTSKESYPKDELQHCYDHEFDDTEQGLIKSKICVCSWDACNADSYQKMVYGAEDGGGPAPQQPPSSSGLDDRSRAGSIMGFSRLLLFLVFLPPALLHTTTGT